MTLHLAVVRARILNQAQARMVKQGRTTREWSLILSLNHHHQVAIQTVATETPAAPVVILDEGTPGETHPAVNEGAPDPEEELLSNASSGGDPVDDVACISASPFSYAEMEEKLKQIPPGSTTVMPSAKMFEVVETV